MNEVNRDMRSYMRCVAKGRKLLSSPHSALLYISTIKDKDIIQCLHHLSKECEPAKIRVMKYIRLTMSAAFSVIRKLDNVRLIHLVRDPRAMMDSQLRKNDMGVEDMPVFMERTVEMCRHMRDDLRLASEIEAEYPGLIYSLRYEDMTDEPMAIAREIFEFLNEEFKEMDKTYVKHRSINSSNNSTVRAAVWRSHITKEHLAVVDEQCGDLYDTLGYIPFTSIEEVRDANSKSHTPKVSMKS